MGQGLKDATLFAIWRWFATIYSSSESK